MDVNSLSSHNSPFLSWKISWMSIFLLNAAWLSLICLLYMFLSCIFFTTKTSHFRTSHGPSSSSADKPDQSIPAVSNMFKVHLLSCLKWVCVKCGTPNKSKSSFRIISMGTVSEYDRSIFIWWSPNGFLGVSMFETNHDPNRFRHGSPVDLKKYLRRSPVDPQNLGQKIQVGVYRVSWCFFMFLSIMKIGDHMFCRAFQCVTV